MLVPLTELVTVTTGGVPVRVTLTQECCAFRAANRSNAAGLIYVGVAGLTRATGAGVIDDVDVGQAFELGSQTAVDNTIDPRDYWVDAANNGEVVMVTIWVHV